MARTLRTHHLVARNTATASENRIHDDEVARRLGFASGLVPGVDVYAYLTRPVVERWGLEWLGRGTLQVSLLHPVYDGGEVAVEAVDPDGTGMEVTVVDSAGVRCATGIASLPAAAPPDPPEIPRRPMPEVRPPASEETLAPGTVLGSLEHGFHAINAPGYLHEVAETLPIYEREGVAHPGWLLRDANHVLAANVELGPWIHVASAVRNHRPVRDGDRLSVRAVVTSTYERRGHAFVELDVVTLLEEGQPALAVRHTAIYRPRQQAG